MGKIKCSNHGLQSIVPICEHISADFKKGVYPYEIFRSPVLAISICKDCYDRIYDPELEKFTYDDIINLTDEEMKKIEKQDDKIEKSIWCAKCVEEIKNANH
ncbi:MAG: hypothetical protein AB8F94_03080 [Saprospiraceae bacterium]